MDNHAEYDQRLEFIKSLFKEEYDLEPTTIAPLEYDPTCPSPFNNFVYLVTLAEPTTSTIASRSANPATAPIPKGTRTLVIRLTNFHAMGMNAAARVQNEVNALSLARTTVPHIVPAVHAWAPSTQTSQGYILLQHMPGKALDERFPNLEAVEQKRVLKQVAELVAAFQRFAIPSTVTGYGGLEFDEEGRVRSAQMTLLPAGPFESYTGLLAAMLRNALVDADASRVVCGWKRDGVRERLEAFIERGVEQLAAGLGKERMLVHADFTLNNLLFDPDTLKLTAILDFDWAHISHPADEFLRSFRDFGSFPDHDAQGGEAHLRRCLLQGNFPRPLPEDERVDWKLTEAWDEALKGGNATRIANITGFEKIAGIFWLAGQIGPFGLVEEFVIKTKTAEDLEAERQKVEEKLVKYLAEHGF